MNPSTSMYGPSGARLSFRWNDAGTEYGLMLDCNRVGGRWHLETDHQTASTMRSLYERGTRVRVVAQNKGIWFDIMITGVSVTSGQRYCLVDFDLHAPPMVDPKFMSSMQKEIEDSCAAALKPFVVERLANMSHHEAERMKSALEASGMTKVTTEIKPNGIVNVKWTVPMITQTFVVDMVENPLDVEYDGVKLSDLLWTDELARTEDPTSSARHTRRMWTSAQRAAVSTHWSTELRIKVKASTEAEKERDRQQVVLEGDPKDYPW